MAEREGSVAAAGRLKTREEERVQLETRLQRLRAKRERVRVTVSQDVLADAIERLKAELQEGSIVARRRALKSFVHKIEVGKEKGTLYYTFPLQVLALNELVYLGSTPGATRTRAHGFGGRRSIRLSYGGTFTYSLPHCPA